MRFRFRSLLLLPLALTLAAEACLPSGESPGGSGKNGNAEAELNNSIILENEGPPLTEPATDDSIIVTNSTPADTHLPLSAGGSMQVQIPFNAPQGNVVAAGIRFGATGPVKVVNLPQSPAGQTQGTLTFAFQVPDSVCANLSNICHDIKCYEFAVTSAGKISKANITALALQCGNCDEPSCQELLDSCDSVNGTWSGDCPSIGAVNGEFSFGIAPDGQVSGSYTGSGGGGDVTGSMNGSQLTASGGAGDCTWTGTVSGTSGNGTWSCSNPICSGTWST